MNLLNKVVNTLQIKTRSFLRKDKILISKSTLSESSLTNWASIYWLINPRFGLYKRFT